MDRREHLGAYYYISNRIVSELLSMPEVPRPRRRVQLDGLTPELSLGGDSLIPTAKVSAEVSFEQYQETLQERAARLTNALESEHQVGGLSDPLRPYLRLRLDAYMATFDVVHGWDWKGVAPDSYSQRVMLLAASQVSSGKRVFVGLIGSAHNLLNSGVTSPVSHTQGRTPSDIDGLYDLFHQIREREDARVNTYRLDTNRRMTDLEVAQDTMSLAQGSPGDGPPRRVEVLLKRHRPPLTGIISLDDDFLAPYNLVLIGAPVWIREIATSDGSPALPRMDEVGPASHSIFNSRRRELVQLARSAVAENVALKALQERFEALGGVESQKSDNPAELVEKRRLAAGIVERLQARQMKLMEYSEQEDALLAYARDPANWPAFADWFTTQACLDGVPLVYLEVERRPSWWDRLRRRRQIPPPPDQTQIAGVVVTVFSGSDDSIRDDSLPLGVYRDALQRDHRYPGTRPAARHMLLTPTGELYAVSVWSFRRHDPHARVVYLSPDSKDNQLKQGESPTPDPQLVETATRAMLEAAMRWRLTLRRAVPDAPWLHDDRPFGVGAYAESPIKPPVEARIASIDARLADPDED